MSQKARRPRERSRIRDLASHPEPYVTPRQLGRYLLVDRRTIMKWITAGSLPAYQFEGEWRIKTADARAFELQHKYRIA